MAESGGISHIQRKDKGSSDRPRAEGCPKLKKGDEGAPAGTNRELSPGAGKRSLFPAFYLKLTSGLRRGELLILLWTDKDLKN